MAAIPTIRVPFPISPSWIDGPPTKPGLYVIEWGNAGGLDVYIIVSRGGILYCLDTNFHYPSRDNMPLKNWYIKRHLPIPQTPAHNDQQNGESYYSDAYNIEEEDFKTNLEDQEKRRRLQDTCLNCGHYPNWWPIVGKQGEGDPS